MIATFFWALGFVGGSRLWEKLPPLSFSALLRFQIVCFLLSCLSLHHALYHSPKVDAHDPAEHKHIQPIFFYRGSGPAGEPISRCRLYWRESITHAVPDANPGGRSEPIMLENFECEAGPIGEWFSLGERTTFQGFFVGDHEILPIIITCSQCEDIEVMLMYENSAALMTKPEISA